MNNFLLTKLIPTLSKLLSSRLYLVLILASTSGYATELSAPIFSHESGFYPEEFELSLSHPNPDATIYYTLDGSDPDPKNLEGKTFRFKNNYSYPPTSDDFLALGYMTYKYAKTIFIQNLTPQENLIANFRTSFPDNLLIENSIKNKLIFIPNKAIHLANKIGSNLNSEKQFIFNQIKPNIIESSSQIQLKKPPLIKGNIVKAVAKVGHNLSNVESKVFFVEEKVNLPVINLTLSPTDLFEYSEGIFTPGMHYDNYLKSQNVHTGITSNHKPANWGKHGGKKDAHLTLITPNFINDALAEVKIHGNGSRAYDMKSLRIYLNKKTKYKLFDNQTVKKSRLILRNGGDTRWGTYFADAAIQQSFKGLNFITQRYEPLVTFINGEYYGIYNLRDRLDRHTLAERTGLNNKKISIHKNKVSFPEEIHFKQRTIQESKGSEDHLHEEFINTLKNNKATTSSFKETVSIPSLIDYYAAEIFIANSDWIKNNLSYWRYTGQQKDNNLFSDGKYRWLMYDIDAVGGNRNSKKNAQHPTLHLASNNKYYLQSLHLTALLKNSELKLEFITRFSDLLNSWFQPERMTQIIRDAERTIEEEMPRHIERWDAPKSMEHWRSSVNNLIEFFKERPKYQWQHLQEFFELEGPYEVQVDIAELNTGKVQLNTLTLGDNPNLEYQVTDTPLFFSWKGLYFKKLPLTLEAMPAEGYKFSHWEASLNILDPNQITNPQIVLYPEEDITLKAVFITK